MQNLFPYPDTLPVIQLSISKDGRKNDIHVIKLSTFLLVYKYSDLHSCLCERTVTDGSDEKYLWILFSAD